MIKNRKEKRSGKRDAGKMAYQQKANKKNSKMQKVYKKHFKADLKGGRLPIKNHQSTKY